MDRRHQVFVSSTYRDLLEERQEVMQALLELDCIPSGMELFPAANDDQWSLITKVIDDCDYYMVIVAGRYGSTNEDGVSFTELEYRYALKQGKPIVGFIHKNPDDLPASRCEESEEGRRKLGKFRELVQGKMVKFWETPAELGSVVSRSLVKLTKSNPSPGWVRADQLPDESAAEEILRLRKTIDSLEAKLEKASTEAPKGTADLAQGEDTFDVEFSFRATPRGQHTLYGKGWTSSGEFTWDQLFAAVGPVLINEAAEGAFRARLGAYVGREMSEHLSENDDLANHRLDEFKVADESFQQIKVQLRALGLIAHSTRNRSVKDKNTYWTLTPYGDSVMNRLVAITRTPRGAHSPVPSPPSSDDENGADE